MKACALAMIAAVAAWAVLAPPVVAAKGGGHGGGGHSSGGHSSGGHSSSGHSSGGHASGGHASGARTPQGSGSPTTPAHGTSPTAPRLSTTEATNGRPRDGRPIVGTAVPRANTPSTLPVPPPLLVPSRIWPYAGGTLSFGYFGAWPYSSPFWFPGYPPGGAAPDPFDTSGPEGGLRLSVEPKDAEVFVDGYFAGIVDDFDGHFQHLDLPAGPHHVEVRAAGHEPLVVDLTIPAHHTTVYRGRLTPSQP